MFSVRIYRSPWPQFLLLSACFFCLLLTWGTPAHARTVLDLDTRNQPVDLKDWGDYWIDTTGKLTAAEVSANPTLPWQPTYEDQIFTVLPGGTVWIRIFVPPAPDAERWYLEVPHAPLDRVSLYTLDNAGNWNEQRAGDSTPVSK